jgi:hypothetical protein
MMARLVRLAAALAVPRASVVLTVPRVRQPSPAEAGPRVLARLSSMAR